MSNDVVIVSAARTPVGSFNGAFATMPAHDLGAIAIRAALERGGIEPARVSEVIMGQILTAAQGQNPARQASIAAGIPVESPAWGVNQLCGSGLRTVALGYQALLNGDSEIVVAGGQESMSMAPHAQYLRGGTKMGPIEFVDTMIKDGLWDAFNGYHMGQHRRERCEAVPDHAPATGRVRRRLAEQGRGRAEGRQVQGRDRPGRPQAGLSVCSRTPWPSGTAAFGGDSVYEMARHLSHISSISRAA
jgi:acetyl-CoA C-acetyltransferase